MTVRQEAVASGPHRAERRTSRRGFGPISKDCGPWRWSRSWSTTRAYRVSPAATSASTSSSSSPASSSPGCCGGRSDHQHRCARALLRRAGAPPAAGRGHRRRHHRHRGGHVLPPLRARSVFVDGIASALYVGNYRFASRAPTTWRRTCRPRRSCTTGRWASRSSSIWCGRADHRHRVAGRAGRAPGAAASRATPYAVVLGLVGAASLAAAVLWTRTSPPWAFFSLPTRAWELAGGGLVALSLRQWRRLPLLSAAVAGWGGLGLILLTCTQLSPTPPTPAPRRCCPCWAPRW